MRDAALKIAIDGRELMGKPTGVGRYLLEILRAWYAAEFPHDITLVTPAIPDEALTTSLPRVKWHVERANSYGTRWEQTRLPKALAELKPDVFFAPAYTGPLKLPCPMVVAIHDVSFFAHPEWFARREGWRRRWLTRATSKRAHTVLTVSNFARSEILKYLPAPARPIVVAPNGAPSPVSHNHSRREPLLLYVGSLFQRRHIEQMIRAFAVAARMSPEVRLILVGDNRTMPRIDPRAIAAQAQVADQVEWREYVTDEERDALYRRASGFVFLSDYEGFGIPPLEAAAHGVPSLVLDTEVSREVYGEGALRVSADNEAIGQGMVSLLTDAELRHRLLAAAKERLAAYSWRTTADTVRRVLEEAARR